ncbi:MAG TPA: response regulator [Roseimicrobium sp.]|nr:response regulator [Roseimicrobium sp.]
MATILLADDNAELLKLQSVVLGRAGHEVITVANGRQALKLAVLQPVDLVITDIIMPDMEGLELIMTLRKNLPALKIIAVSGGGRGNANDYLSVARTLGAQAILLKPFTASALLDAVNKVLSNVEGESGTVATT